MASWEDAPVVNGGGKPAWEAAPAVAPKKAGGLVDTALSVLQLATPAGVIGALASPEGRDTLLNAGAGAIRGAGSIGATAIAPIDIATDALDGKGLSLQGNRQRRADMDASLKDLGADPESGAYGFGKVASEVGGTLGAGSALGLGAKAAGAAPAVVDALTTGGMSAGGAKGLGGLALRAGAGAVTGGVSAGMVDPQTAAKGAAIGGAAPVVAQGLGAAGRALGRKAGAVGDPVAAQKLETARAAAEQGYVIPPVDLPNPGIVNQAISGMSGKIKTAQTASQRNQVVTDKLARRALGLDDIAELSPDALNAVRQRAAEAYGPVRSAGTVTADDVLAKRLDQIAAVSQGAKRSFPGAKDNGVQELVDSVRVRQFDASDGVDMITALRAQADDAFRRGDSTLGRASKGVASALEDQLERHLSATSPEAVKGFQEARKLIAKTYTVQKAVNPTTGSVSAPVLARELQKGKPLSDELRQIAEFSQAYPRASQALKEAPGQVSPLDWLFAGGAGMGAGSSPVGAAALAARPVARSILLSKPVQQRLLQQPNQEAGAFQLFMDRALPLTGRAAPVLLSNQ